MSALEIEKKKEFKRILNELELLKLRETAMMEKVSVFARDYDVMEKNRLEGKVIPKQLLLQRKRQIEDLKIKINQVDYDRERIFSHSRNIKKGRVSNIKRNQRQFVAQNIILENRKPDPYIDSAKYFDIPYMQGKIQIQQNRIRDLQRANRNFLENELLDEGLQERSGKRALEKNIPKMKTFVLSTADRVRDMEDKALKLTQIREAIETHGWDKGLSKSRAIVKFEEDVLATEYQDTGDEIE